MDFDDAFTEHVLIFYQPWLSLRVNWQASVKSAIGVVKAAHGVNDGGEVSTGAGALVTTSSQTGTLTAPPFLQTESREPSSCPPSNVDSDSVVMATDGQPDKMQLLFAKFDQMTLTAAFERILPSVKKADEQGQYIAICVNIQLAALAVNYILTVSL